MWRIAILFLASSLAHGQLQFVQMDLPEQQISDAIVSTGMGDTVAVFLQCFDNRIKQFYYCLTEGEMITQPVEVQSWQGVEPELLDAQLLDDLRWVCVFRTHDIEGADSVRHYGWLAVGTLGGTQETEMIHNSLEQDNTFDSGGPLVDARISAAHDGGYVATATGVGRWGVEPVSGVGVYSDLGFGWGVGDHECFAYPYCWSEDSVDVLVSRNLGGNAYGRFVLNCDTCLEGEVIIEGDWSCYANLLLTTISGRRLAVYSSTLFEVDSNGACIELGAFAEPEGFWPYTPWLDTAPCCGFAFFEPFPYETLMRVDTNGTEYNRGAVHFNGGGHRLKMNRQGEVAVTSHTGTRVYCTIVPWDVLLDADDNGVVLPKNYRFIAYPNPFNSTVRIDYDLPRASDVRLSIFNTLGQEIATLVDGRSEAGTHTLAWSPTGTSGVYFVKLVAGELVTSQKILYIR